MMDAPDAREAPARLTILVVDDNEDLRRAMGRSLTQAGFRVIEAGNGFEAIKLFGAGKVDLVVTDIVMPDMEGLELIRKLRQTMPRTRILATSGGGIIHSGQYLHTASLLGAERVLAKPFSVADLVRAVQDLLRNEP